MVVMEEVKFYAVEALPSRLSSNEDGVYFVKSRVSTVFKYYVVSNGRSYEIDAVTVDKMNQALSVKFDKPNGTEIQYIKGDGTYGTMDKNAVGLGNVDNTSDLNKPISTATQNALNNKADDNKVVHIEGDETIVGGKTFTKAVMSPTTPTDDFHLTNKIYVDNLLGDSSELNSVKKDKPNTITNNFTLEREYLSGNTFRMDTFTESTGEDVVGIGVNDDNGEGVRMYFLQDSINLRTTEGGDKSMSMDGRKITFDRFNENKLPNDVSQMKDINDLKQWVIDNFLSLSGGTVNGDITANKFFEK